MKTLIKISIISLFLAVLLLQSCSSKKEYRLQVFHYINSAGETGKTTYIYDDTGINFGAKWELLDASRSSENYHTYDENGNMVLKYREFSDGLISYNWYTYNEHNHLIKEKFFRSDSVQGLTYYNYDGSGTLLSMDCQGLNGWFHGTIKMNYNDEGLKTKADILKDDTLVGSIAYTYKNDLLAEEYWEFKQGFNQRLSYEYQSYTPIKRLKYTSSNAYLTNTFNYKVILEEYDYNNEGGGPSYFEYDEDGKLVKKIFVRADGLKTITDFYYKGNGHLERSIRNYNSGEKGVFEYRYNGNGLLKEKTFSLPGDVHGYEIYNYNGKFQLQSAELLNFDKWITGRIDYTYDDSGKLSQGKFKGKEFDADIDFVYDDENNIIEYQWKMSFGATQTYKFIYKKID